MVILMDKNCLLIRETVVFSQYIQLNKGAVHHNIYSQNLFGDSKVQLGQAVFSICPSLLLPPEKCPGQLSRAPRFAFSSFPNLKGYSMGYNTIPQGRYDKACMQILLSTGGLR